MFRRTYKVKGEDVNDFMVMQNFAYSFYTNRLFESFLFEMGYSKQKLAALKIDAKISNKKIIHQKHLMFPQSFFVSLDISYNANKKEKMNITNRFFNTKNKLCTIITKELHWFDYKREIISPPKKMMDYFYRHTSSYTYQVTSR